MRIGLTYDLRSEYLAAGYGEEETAEFDRAETIDALDAAIREHGHQTDRIGNARQLIERLAAGDRWELVFNICEGLQGIGREAQVPAILDVYGIPYTFSDPAVMSLCLHKGLTKHIVRSAGLPTADFVVIEDIQELAKVTLAFPVFAKPIAEGTGKGIAETSKIDSAQQLRRECLRILADFRQPALVETYLPGREFTVGIVGTGAKAEVLGAMEVAFSSASGGTYSYTTKRDYEQLVEYSLLQGAEAERVHEIAKRSWTTLGCRDGGRIDFRCDAAGRPQFLEVNPLPGLNPDHSDLPILCRLANVSYEDLIRRIVNSAAQRASPRDRHLAHATGQLA
jgi:D-alanine-D-alanine ligase